MFRFKTVWNYLGYVRLRKSSVARNKPAAGEKKKD